MVERQEKNTGREGRRQQVMTESIERGERKGGGTRGRFLTESLVHHRLLLLFLTLFIQQRTEGIPDKEREGNRLYFTVKKRETVKKQPRQPLYLWLLADGRHRNMMTNRMMENKKRQNASSIHSSLQSFRHTQREIFNENTSKALKNLNLQDEKRLKIKYVSFSAGLNLPDRIYRLNQRTHSVTQLNCVFMLKYPNKG